MGRKNPFFKKDQAPGFSSVFDAEQEAAARELAIVSDVARKGMAAFDAASRKQMDPVAILQDQMKMLTDRVSALEIDLKRMENLSNV